MVLAVPPSRAVTRSAGVQERSDSTSCGEERPRQRRGSPRGVRTQDSHPTMPCHPLSGPGVLGCPP
jgi:hypothetical protein